MRRIAPLPITQLAVVGAAGRDHDHLALGLGESASFSNQRIVIGKERRNSSGRMCERQENVRK